MIADAIAAKAILDRTLTFASSWWKAAVGAAVVAAPLFLLGQCHGVQLERDRAKVEAAKITVRAAETRVTAAEERAADNNRITARQEDLSSADDQAADSRPSDARRSRNCRILCRQGADISRVPGCEGFACGAEAATRP